MVDEETKTNKLVSSFSTSHTRGSFSRTLYIPFRLNGTLTLRALRTSAKFDCSRKCFDTLACYNVLHTTLLETTITDSA